MIADVLRSERPHSGIRGRKGWNVRRGWRSAALLVLLGLLTESAVADTIALRSSVEWTTGEGFTYSTFWIAADIGTAILMAGGDAHGQWQGGAADSSPRQTYSGFIVEYSPIPEPSTLALLGLGGFGLLWVCRRRVDAVICRRAETNTDR